MPEPTPLQTEPETPPADPPFMPGELVVRCAEHAAAVLAYARGRKIEASLHAQLVYLLTYAPHTRTRCTLFRGLGRETMDFDFTMEKSDAADGEWKFWFNGGICLNGETWGTHT